MQQRKRRKSMNCRSLPVLVGISIAFASAPGRAEEKTAILKEADIRAILEAGQTAKLPAGVFIRVHAQLSRSVPADAALRVQAERKGVDFTKTLRETWEFTSNRVYRVDVETPKKSGDSVVYRRVEAAPFDSSSICKEMLDARIFTLGDEEEGEHQHFVGTDYDVGHRSIELFVNGKSAFHVGESCAVAGFAEKDARAFAALYETLASKARDMFTAKGARKGEKQ
jgi:hypothetical protein